MHKICARCKKEKSIEHFARKSRWYQPYCRECQKKYRSEHYLRNRQKYIKKAKVWGKKIRAEVYLVKNRPCMDCGNTYPPYVMDFDHRNGEDKSFTIGVFAGRLSIKRLWDEIGKCDVICSNCHRIRTWKRRHPNVTA